MKKVLSTTLLSSLLLCGIGATSLNAEATEVEQANSNIVTENIYASGPNLVSNPNFSKLDSQGYITDWVRKAGPYTLQILPYQGYLSLNNSLYQGHRKKVESTKKVTLTGGVTYEVSVTSKGSSLFSQPFTLELNEYSQGVSFKQSINRNPDAFMERKFNVTPGITGNYSISFTNDYAPAPDVLVSNVSIAAK